jgi:hypothetical protein
LQVSDQATETDTLLHEQLIFSLPPPCKSAYIQTDPIPPEILYETVIEYRAPPKPVMIDRELYFGPQMGDQKNGSDLVCNYETEYNTHDG